MKTHESCDTIVEEHTTMSSPAKRSPSCSDPEQHESPFESDVCKAISTNYLKAIDDRLKGHCLARLYNAFLDSKDPQVAAHRAELASIIRLVLCRSDIVPLVLPQGAHERLNHYLTLLIQPKTQHDNLLEMTAISFLTRVKYEKPSPDSLYI